MSIHARRWGCLLMLICASQARADLFFPKNDVQLGERRCGVPLEHRFELWNNGRSPLKIISVRGSCGCIQPVLTKKIYAPGDKGEILLRVRTLGQPAGARKWQMDVVYQIENETYHRFVLLHANLIREIQVRPANLLIQAKKRIRHEIVITDVRDAKPFPLTKMVTSNSHLKAKSLGVKNNSEGHPVQVVELIVEETFPEGRHEVTLSIYSDDPLYRELVVPVTVVRESKKQVTANPSSVSITGSADRPLPSRIVLLRGSDDKPVEVDRVECQHPSLKCRWAKGPGKMSTLRILIDQKSPSLSDFDSSVHVHLKKRDKPVVIPVKCELR